MVVAGGLERSKEYQIAIGSSKDEQKCLSAPNLLAAHGRSSGALRLGVIGSGVADMLIRRFQAMDVVITCQIGLSVAQIAMFYCIVVLRDLAY